MPDRVLLVTLRHVPYALQSNVRAEVRSLLPHQYEAYPSSPSPPSSGPFLADAFAAAKARGLRTICLGTVGAAAPPPNPVGSADVSERLVRWGVDYCSGWDSYPWRSASHDAQLIQECAHFIEEEGQERGEGGKGGVFVCLNLLSCRDVLHVDLPRANDPTHPRAVPPSVAKGDRQRFVDALALAHGVLCDVGNKVVPLLSRAVERGYRVGMTAACAFAMGEHGHFGSSPYREGTTTFFASNVDLVAARCGYASSYARALVGESMKEEDSSYPFSVNGVDGGPRRTIYTHHERTYASVGGELYDLATDPFELRDVRKDFAHVPALQRDVPPSPPRQFPPPPSGPPAPPPPTNQPAHRPLGKPHTRSFLSRPSPRSFALVATASPATARKQAAANIRTKEKRMNRSTNW